MNIFLSEDEMKELTGYLVPTKQISWLRNNGICFMVAADCRPRVLREHLMQMLGATTSTHQRSKPDRKALESYQNRLLA